MTKIYKRGKYWWLDYYENGIRRQKSTKTTRKEIAENIAREKEKELLLGRYVKEEMPIMELIELYECSIKAKYPQRTSQRYCEVLEHIRDYFNRTSVSYASEVTRKEIEKYIVERANTGLKPVTINYELGRLQQLWDYAVDIGVAIENPVKKTPKLTEPNRKPPRFLTKEEIPVFLKSLRQTAPHFEQIAIFILYSGLRRDEVFKLNWEDINLGQMKFRVRDGKGDKSRDIPLHPKALEAINKFFNEFSQGRAKTGNVFHTLKGTPLTRGNLYESFKRAGKRAGLVGNIGVHTLRHTFATHLAMAGVPVRTLQEYMGHTDIQTTMIYLHLAESHWESEIQKLDYEIE